MSVAGTKVQPPRPRPDLLVRPALEARLAAALGVHRLVLLHAPAGYGKTSLLARLAARAGAAGPLAWLSCDEDDDPPRFLAGLLTALDPFDLPWRVQPEALCGLLAQPGGRAEVTGHLVNALAAVDAAHATLVLDDLHRIVDPAVLAWVDTWLERLPDRWTLVVAARSEPALALPRLRARGELAEFGAAELGFTTEETAAIVTGAGWDAATAAALHARTRGWPAGLRLAMTVLQGAPQAGLATLAPTIDRRIFDFLVAEVLDRLDPALREFLLATSPLPELTAARGAALSGDADAARHLQAIERLGLAVSPLVPATGALRLHELVREALELRLRQQDPARHRQALRHAAATETDELRRVAWLLRAKDWAAAEALLDAVADDQAAAGATGAVLTLCGRFPAAWRAASAPLDLLATRLRWDWDRAIEAGERAAAQFARRGDADRRRHALSHRAAALAGANRGGEARALIAELRVDPQLQGENLVRTLRAAAWIEFADGRSDAVAAIWRELVDVLERSDRLALWTASAPLPVFVGLPGMGPLLHRFVAGARARLPEPATPLRAACTLLEAWRELWAGRVDTAERLVAAAADDARWLARPPGLDAPTRTLTALLAALRGDGRAATAGLQALIDDVAAGGSGFRAEVYLGLYEHLAMRCAALVDDDATLRRMATRQLATRAGGRGLLAATRRQAAAAWLATADGQAEAACGHWEALLDDPQHGDVYGLVAESRLRLADARLRAGQPATRAAAALEPLWPAIDADGDGVALLAGPAVLERLAAVAWGEALSAAHAARLTRWAAQARALRVPAAGPTVAAAAQRLSEREREVLARIAAGDSNKLIARALDLSPHTVKRHVANILDKLTLGSRGQAAAWWQAQQAWPPR